MNRLLGSVFAVAICASVPALAAPGDLQDQKFAPRNQGEAGPRTGVPPIRLAEDRRDNDRGRGDNNDRGRGDNNDRGRGDNGPGPRAGGPGPRADGRRVEHGPSQFERRAFQRNFNAPRRFRMGAFRAPPGWAYRRWAFGESLPRAFWAQNYWITNFWLYDLDRPPLGCEWVRSGPDALLVDTSSGEILQAEYNVFY